VGAARLLGRLAQVSARHCEQCLRPVHQAVHAFTGKQIPIVCPASYMAAEPGEWAIWTVHDHHTVDYCAPRAQLDNVALRPHAHAWRGDVHECYGGER